MAKPIKETPILHGKDAKRFVAKMIYDDKNRASDAEYNRVICNYQKLKGLLKESK